MVLLLAVLCSASVARNVDAGLLFSTTMRGSMWQNGSTGYGAAIVFVLCSCCLLFVGCLTTSQPSYCWAKNLNCMEFVCSTSYIGGKQVECGVCGRERATTTLSI